MTVAIERIALAGMILLAVLTATTQPAAGQLTTERYIPIGQSPGLSGKYSAVGTIKSFETASRTLNFDATGGTRSVTLTDRTKIWLDRSKIRQTNLMGDPADLKAGRRIEVKFEDPDQKRVAAWIKIEIAGPN